MRRVGFQPALAQLLAGCEIETQDVGAKATVQALVRAVGGHAVILFTLEDCGIPARYPNRPRRANTVTTEGSVIFFV